jgi:hypothetical protein
MLQVLDASCQALKPFCFCLLPDLESSDLDIGPILPLIYCLYILQYYAPALARWWVKIPIVIFFLLWGAGSLYGVRRVKYGQPLSDLAPDGSYVQDYDHEQTVSDTLGVWGWGLAHELGWKLRSLCSCVSCLLKASKLLL